jgi:hypothetical protein
MYHSPEIGSDMQCYRVERILTRTWLPVVVASITTFQAGMFEHYFELLLSSCFYRTCSLILCHDKSKQRVRQIEKFVEVCSYLRTTDNYSSLRAIVSGIDNSTFEGDETFELFKQRPVWRKHEQYQLLFSSSRSHKNYRVALVNQGGHQSEQFKGCCIPALCAFS